jgi:hypothetical protein
MADFTLRIEDKELKRGFANFNKASRVAVRETLNIAAILSHRAARRNISNQFTLRNTFTKRQVQFQKVQNVRINDMFSSTGATQKADYLETQEIGGRRKRKGRATAIPQTNVRIGRSFAKPVSRDFYVRKIQKNMVKGAFKKNIRNRRSRGVAQIAMAWKTKKFILRGGNIYKVKSFSGGRGRPIRAKLQRLYYIERKDIFIKANPWLRPSTKKPTRDMSNIYKSQLRKLWKDARFV